MVVGYLLESVLGQLFALGFLIKGFPSTTSPSKTRDLLAEGCQIFFDCAIFFVVSIQISCVVVLARKDFGISANGLGGLTVQITWAVALVCMLPLLYPLVILEYTHEERSNFRFSLFCGCWILFFYTFISQMIGEFAPSQVGVGAGGGGSTIIKPEQMDALDSLCLTGVPVLTSTEQTILKVFGAAGSIIISIYGLAYLIWFILQRQYSTQAKCVQKKLFSVLPSTHRGQVAISALAILVPILTIPQFWGIFRLREIQRSLAGATSNAYVDNQWTFGQVVAVTIFAPVFTEMGYLMIQNFREP